MNTDKLISLFQEQFERCKLKNDETAVVLTGERSSEAYAKAALQAIQNLGATGFRIDMPKPRPLGFAAEGTYVGVTPVTGQKLVMETLKKADFVVDLLLLLHSPEQVEILNSGARILLVVEPQEILESRPPTDEMRRLVEQSGEILKQSKTLKVTSSAGTNFEMELGEYPVVTQYGYTDAPGRWDHWPSSFLYTWPNERSTCGTVILDKGDFIWPLNRYLDAPITLKIKDGYIYAIEGGKDADELRQEMAKFNDPEAYAVSHIGWGVDPRANWNALKDFPTSVGTDPRSYSGNVQFSTGPNTEAGGNRHTMAHFDMPMLRCTLSLDGREMLRDGVIVPIA